MDIDQIIRNLHALRRIGHSAVDTLYPQKRSCLFCGRYWSGSKLTMGICPICILDWRRFRATSAICPLCGSFDNGDPCRGPCEGWRGHWPDVVGSLAAIHAAAPYAGVYRQRIMALKYNGQKHLALSMAYLMTEAWRGAWADILRDNIPVDGVRSKPCLVPVPMHQEKEAYRGYNQSRLLAHYISKESGFPVKELLYRPIAGRMQAGLGKNHRRKALDQVFQWSGAAKQEQGAAILVDDVVTTGATLESCARILRQHGFQPIWGLTFAGGGGGKAGSPS